MSLELEINNNCEDGEENFPNKLRRTGTKKDRWLRACQVATKHLPCLNLDQVFAYINENAPDELGTRDQQ